MKILIYGINFKPELTGIGKYSGEMSDWLADRNHEIHVITAPPYYPEWSIRAGFSNFYSVTHENLNYKVYRCPIWVPKKASGIKRMLHLLSFVLSSFPVLLLQCQWKPDIVFTLEPTVLCAPQAYLISRFCRARSWLHIQDLEFDAAFNLGIVSLPLIKNILMKLDVMVTNKFDVVSTISVNMQSKLVKKGIDKNKIFLFPNWVDLQNYVFDKNLSLDYRRKLGIDDKQVVALYSGNMGKKQGLEILVEVIKSFKNSARITFVLCGAGVMRDYLQKHCEKFDNVKFLALQSKELLPVFLGIADIHLLPQRREASSLVMPSRMTTMLTSGKPIVGIAEQGSDVEIVLRTTGICCIPDRSIDFSNAIKLLAESPILREKLGLEGKIYAFTNLDKEKILLSFEKKLFNILKD
jgi:colanic acid biosynthesis glycosyl transferase WcaI